MSVTVDVDIGGTFTDCVAIRDGKIVRKKAPTTRYNLAVGFRKVLEETALSLRMPLRQLLQDAELVRYSTTLAMNTLIERKGPKLGLITTRGNEHMLYIGRSRQWADGLHVTEIRDMSKIRKPEPLIPLEMVVGVRERVDCFGSVVIPLDKEDVRQKVQQLVDRGVRGFVVCLLWSHVNPEHERSIREIIEEEYPDVYLGNMPIMLSNEIHPKWHEYPRANVAILNGYLQTEMAAQLHAMEDELRDYGYRRPLTVINNNGGMAKLSRTKAVDTFGAGPVAGLFGAAHLGRLYGMKNIVVSDMGGTSFDFGLVVDGMIRHQAMSVIDRWLTETSMVEVNTIGAGGGSIAWVNQGMGGVLEVGPQSAGSAPGPACYDMGGKLPTVTDADVILGYIDPEYFLGGKMQLNRAKAFQAMRTIAEPLGLTVEEAAAAVRRVIDAKMGNIIEKELCLGGHDPRIFTLLAYGGAGPVHCCDYAEHVGVKMIVTFPFASVFCAMGGATMDLSHMYERSHHIELYTHNAAPESQFITDYSLFNSTVEGCMAQAHKDLKAEGFSQEKVKFSLDLDMRYGGQFNLTRITSPVIKITGPTDVRQLFDTFNLQYEKKFSAMTAFPQAGVQIENFYLTASVGLRKPEFPTYPLADSDSSSARKGKRSVYWEVARSSPLTPIYNAGQLMAGHVVKGPGVIEAIDTTYVIPPGWTATVDQYLNLIIKKTNVEEETSNAY